MLILAALHDFNLAQNWAEVRILIACWNLHVPQESGIEHKNQNAESIINHTFKAKTTLPAVLNENIRKVSRRKKTCQNMFINFSYIKIHLFIGCC